MKYLKTARIVLFFLAFFSFGKTGFCKQILYFNAKPSTVTSFYIAEFLKNQSLPDVRTYGISALDLNGDGLDEYVLRPLACEKVRTPCEHLILAEKGNKIILLSTIKANRLVGADTYSHGIQDFLAFQNDNNDYEYERYIWSPQDAAFIMKKEE